MNFILSTLKNAKEQNQIVSIHTDPYDQSVCSVGFVDQINDAEVRLKSLSPRGEAAGYEIRLIKDICRVDSGGLYEKKIGFLGKNFGKILKKVELTNPIEDEGLIYTSLNEAKQQKLIVVIWAQDKDDSIVGYVVDLNPETVKILSIDDNGKEDGIIVQTLNIVTSVDCNSIKCQLIKFLNKNGIGSETELVPGLEL